MATLDILAFPHILDDVLHQLHLDGQNLTLARFRATCSAVKDIVDQRLPEHAVILQGDSFPEGFTQDLSSEPEMPVYLSKQTRLWNLRTEGWARNPIGMVVDVRPNKARERTFNIHQPRWQESSRVSVLRLLEFDCERSLPACSADTVIVFPKSTSHAGVGGENCIYLPYDARRIIIHMPYSPARLSIDQPSDCFFAYKSGPMWTQYHSPDRGRIPIIQLCQEIIIVLPTTPEGIIKRGLRDLPRWVLSIRQAVFHNSALQVTVLADNWNWEWLVWDGHPEYHHILNMSDVAERFAFAWGVYWERTCSYMYPASKSILNRIKHMTMAKYEAHVGPRMFQLMQP